MPFGSESMSDMTGSLKAVEFRQVTNAFRQ